MATFTTGCKEGGSVATVSSYDSYFGTSIPGTSLGYTQKFGGNTIYSAVVNGLLSTTQSVEEIAAHELGHAADIIYSDQSNNSTLETYVAQDYLYLDYSTVGSSAGTSTARPPCGTGGVFTGLNDESTGKAFCVTSATTGYTKIGTNLYLESKYVSGGKPLRNSQIIQQASRMFAWGGGDGWLELYAQAFGFEAYVTTLSSGYVYYTADPVLKAGYFACQLDWSYDVLNNFAVPPASAPHPYPAANGFGTCNSVPTWYRTLLGH